MKTIVPRETRSLKGSAAEDWLDDVGHALASAGLEAEKRQEQQLATYLSLLATWNATYNLTALRTREDVLSHHLADCLAVVAPFQRRMAQAEAGGSGLHISQVLDVGSGGGLPGVVLAVLCPNVIVTCVDTVGKKAAFVRQVAAQAGLGNLKAEHARVQQLQGRFDVITSRAFASLADFTEWSAHLLADQGWWMAMKGRRPDEQLKALPPQVQVVEVEPLAVPALDAERCLVWMRHAS